MTILRQWALLCCVAVLAYGPARSTGAADAPAKEPAKQAPGKDAAKKKRPVNTVCPVSDDEADPAQTVTYQGKLVAFCCEDCVGAFNKNPKKFAAKVAAAEKQAKQKKKDAGRSKGAEKPAGNEQPKKGEQPAGKPVNTLCVVHPEDAVDPTVTAEYEGKLIGFCCVDCRDKFDLDPERYAARLKK